MTKPRLRYDPTNDFYTVLGVQPSAVPTEINRAYRQRAKEVHPDLNRDRSSWAHDQFQRVRDAYDTLTDPTLRTEYDERRRAYLQPSPGLGTSRTSSYTEASRAAWKRRQRRQPPYIFLIPLVLTILSCWMLKFSQPDSNPPVVQPANPVSTLSSPLDSTAFPVAVSSSPCANPDVSIDQPTDGATVRVPFRIKGRASGKDFASYSIQIASASPRRNGTGLRWYTLISEVSQPVEDGMLLAQADSLLLTNWHGDYTLRLVVQSNDGNSLLPCNILIHLNPLLDDYLVLPSAR
ncbi:MAG: J domain-containing protein [Chloroflexota bacterium]